MIRELLKLGNWSGGKVTRKIIKQVVRNFSETDRAPIIKGHTVAELDTVKTDDTNLGWVEKMWTSRDLTTTVGKVTLNEQGTKAYFEEGFENCSSGLRKNKAGEWYLHHLGLLSAVPPSIKGLQVLEYAENRMPVLIYKDEGRLEFIVYSPKKQFAEEAAAMAKTTSEKTDSAGQATPQTSQPPAQHTTEEKGKTHLKSIIRKQRHIISQMKKTIKEIQDKNSNQETELANHADAVLKEKKEHLKQAASGKIPKQQLDSLLTFADFFPSEPMEFADKTTMDLFSLLTAIFKGIGKQVAEGEMNMGDLPETLEQDIPVTDYIDNV